MPLLRPSGPARPCSNLAQKSGLQCNTHLLTLSDDTGPGNASAQLRQALTAAPIIRSARLMQGIPQGFSYSTLLNTPYWLSNVGMKCSGSSIAFVSTNMWLQRLCCYRISLSSLTTTCRPIRCDCKFGVPRLHLGLASLEFRPAGRWACPSLGRARSKLCGPPT